MGNTTLTDQQLEHYSRNILLKEVGFAGQEKLLASSVLVIGAGGLGSPAAYYLSAAGIGRITVMDFDKVDITNLQRQIIHEFASIGTPKAVSASERLKAINPHIRIDAINCKLTPQNAMDTIKDYDFIIEAGDNFDVKFLVNDACVAMAKPFSHAGVLRFNGQILTVYPGKSACLRCIFREPPPPNSTPTCTEAGVIGAAAGIIGSMQALECIKSILGIGTPLVNQMAVFDMLDSSYRTVSIKRKDDCPACGNSKAGTGISGLIQKQIKTQTVNETCVDYRGGGCPLHFLRLQRDMLSMKSGEVFTAYLDDGDPIKNVPRTLKSEGHEIISQTREGNAWKLLIRKRWQK